MCGVALTTTTGVHMSTTKLTVVALALAYLIVWYAAIKLDCYDRTRLLGVRHYPDVCRIALH